VESPRRLGVVRERLVDRSPLLQEATPRRRERAGDRAHPGAPCNTQSLVEPALRRFGLAAEHGDHRRFVQRSGESLFVAEPTVAGGRLVCRGRRGLELSLAAVGMPHAHEGLCFAQGA
jgi:hypothetical protein